MRALRIPGEMADSLRRLGIDPHPVAFLRQTVHERGMATCADLAHLRDGRRVVVLTAGMIACHGRVQREGEVVHVVADRLQDLSNLLRSVAGRDGNGTGPSSHAACGVDAPNARPSGLKVPTRDFR